MGLDKGTYIRNSRLPMKLREDWDTKGDAKTRGWQRDGGWPAAHFLRYIGGCKFHMRILRSALASSSHIHIYARSDAVTAAGSLSFQWKSPHEYPNSNISRCRERERARERARESSETGLPLRVESLRLFWITLNNI